MGDFFCGWRRKTGVLTLVIALVFAVAWVRSIGVCDILVFTEGFTSECLQSLGGKLHLIEGSDSTQINERTNLILPVWHVMPRADADIHDSYAPTDPDPYGYWKVTNKTLFEFMGFVVRTHASGSRHESFRNRDIAIPYWSIVFPLTLLSGSLLLSKPRVAKPKNTVEPTLTEGT